MAAVMAVLVTTLLAVAVLVRGDIQELAAMAVELRVFLLQQALAEVAVVAVP
jgi:hypothetical protein